MRTVFGAGMLLAVFISTASAAADGSGDPAAVKNEDGKYYDKDGTPTYKVAPDGTVDWYTYSGFRRYHSECHVCHGPDAEGSSFAPALKDSLKRISYADYLEVVVNGRKNVNTAAENVMPSFGTNSNVTLGILRLMPSMSLHLHDQAARLAAMTL